MTHLCSEETVLGGVPGQQIMSGVCIDGRERSLSMGVVTLGQDKADQEDGRNVKTSMLEVSGLPVGSDNRTKISGKHVGLESRNTNFSDDSARSVDYGVAPTSIRKSNHTRPVKWVVNEKSIGGRMAVANSTSATFLRVVGSELIQKYLGDGPKLVREHFRVADDLSPSIVFTDEIDAVGTKRYDAHSGGEREIQRTMLELLNQLDGFDSRGDVKVILATNRIESLDPALLRPGRIDRKIEFPLPDIKTRRRIFQIHTSKMTLADDVNLEEFVMTKDEFSGADIKAICTEAGLLALRERRMKVTHADFKKAKEKVMFKKKEGVPEGLYM
ncbi:26S protease regulatory subunit 4-like protein [Hibiscus syriacus]|uniref:26S protease regulatory subunit 4-like protein n=1 Tax=Hibiscus syriacus TaxID=106335 RepID=A0A6A2XSQ8_HIBSY|nr:26S protease regulatory subunit 4-like protein [Hibiscus syriacus]